MLNTKVLAAALGVFAFASAGNTQVHMKRALRRAKVVATSNDLTEDVAFWTRSLQASFPPMPPNVETPIPSPTGTGGATSGPPITASSPIPSPTGTGGATDGATTGPPVTASSPIPSPTSTGSFSSLPPVASPIPSPIGTGGSSSGPPVGIPGTFAPSLAETPKATDPPVASNLPEALDDSVTVNAADGVSFVDVLVNDTSSTDQTLTVKSITQNASNGDCSIGLDLLTVVYVPNEGFTGTDSCEYEACDLVPNCVTATVTITVN